VGSSSKTIGVFFSKIRAKAKRWRSPPEKRNPASSTLVSRPSVNTKVDEAGLRFSGGERHRLAPEKRNPASSTLVSRPSVNFCTISAKPTRRKTSHNCSSVASSLPSRKLLAIVVLNKYGV